ncbi:MAG: hypothetical protein ACP5D2_01050, partial [Candidatus Nanoarchaeia archaeon]
IKHPEDANRESLLELNGVGEETADSILLYAYNKPVFVIDAYTRRIFSDLLEGDFTGHSYGEWQDMFHSAFSDLPDREKVEFFKEFHALIVRHGKERN